MKEILWNDNGIDVLCAEYIARFYEALEDRDICITGIIDPGFEIGFDFFKENGLSSGVKHFDISTELGLREMYLDFNSFSKEIIVPSLYALADKIKNIKGELNSVVLKNKTNCESASFSGDGISLLVFIDFDPKYLRTIISVQIMIIEKRSAKN